VYVAKQAEFAGDAGGWYPSLGVAFTGLFDLLRVDVARGLRRTSGIGGSWRFGVDISRDLWRIL
jgi:hypothetical protein